MKVAIVHELLIKMGGAERIVKILSDMFPDAPIYTLLYDQKKCGKTFPKEKVVSSSLQKYYNLGAPLSALRTRMAIAIEDFDFSDYDLVISSSSAFAHGILTDTNTKHVCYCHSPMRYAWDYFHEIVAQEKAKTFGGLRAMLTRCFTHKLRIWDRSSASRAEKIIANSQTVQKRIKKFWGKDSAIIFPPVDINRFVPQKNHEDYFLIVSALQPFKRIDIAVRAFNKLPKHKLLIIGDGDERGYLEGIAGDNIEFLGRKSDETVAEFMQNCRAFIFPGIEDAGITPLEVMACGRPVIAFGKGGVRETVIEGKTGVFFDTQSPQGLNQGLLDFFEIEEKFDYKKIRKRAEEFSEEIFKKKLLKELGF